MAASAHDVRMPGRQGPAPEVQAAAESGPNAAEDALVDKLKGGDYGAMAEQLENKALQLLPGGGVESMSGADAEALVAGAEARERKPRKPVPADPLKAARAAAEEEADSELSALRAARLRQMQNEGKMKQHWVKQGHGVYRTIEDERAFFRDIEPHERTVCLLYRDEADPLHEALAQLAQQHLETMFYQLPEQRAHFMMEMLALEGLPSLLCIRHGKVVEIVPPAALRKHPVARTLRRLGLVDDGEVQAEKARLEDRDDSEDDEEQPRRGNRGFFRRV